MGICKKCGDSFKVGSRCQPCMKIYKANYYLENKEKNEVRDAAYRAENAERKKHYDSKYRENNLEKIKDRQKKHYAINCNAINSRVSEYRKANPEKVRAAINKWESNNRDYLRELSRVDAQNRRARKRMNGGVLSKGLAEKLFKLQHGKCACCSASLGNDYHLDHIMPLALGGKNEDWNIQLLKSTCNLKKHMKHPVDFMQSKGFLL